MKKKPTCTFSYGEPAIQCARRFFHSYLKETKKKKKNQQSILKCIYIYTILKFGYLKPVIFNTG